MSLSSPGDEIGRHTGFKIPGLHGRAGSIPPWGTILKASAVISILTATYLQYPIILDIKIKMSAFLVIIWTLSGKN